MLLFGYSITLKETAHWQYTDLGINCLGDHCGIFFVITEPFTAPAVMRPITVCMYRFIRISVLYAGFVIISLIREVVKDLEDMDGDARYGCKICPLFGAYRPVRYL